MEDEAHFHLRFSAASRFGGAEALSGRLETAASNTVCAVSPAEAGLLRDYDVSDRHGYLQPDADSPDGGDERFRS
jgi:hypothetical protein